jgi:hypothetical protein
MVGSSRHDSRFRLDKGLLIDGTPTSSSNAKYGMQNAKEDDVIDQRERPPIVADADKSGRVPGDPP